MKGASVFVQELPKEDTQSLQRHLQRDVAKQHATNRRNDVTQNCPETRAGTSVALQRVGCNNPISVAVSRCTPSLEGATLQQGGGCVRRCL
jgi:hypothetical protein